MRNILITVLLLTIFETEAQVGIGTLVPHNSAAFEIKDSSRGILIPRMSMIQRNAITTPAEGLMVYQTDNTKGYWYFDGAVWKSMNVSNSVYGGKYTIVLSDDITNQQAQAIIAADYGPNTQEIRIIGCTNLTAVDLSIVTTALNIYIVDNSVLQSINLQNLQSCYGDFVLEESPVLNNLNLSTLSKIIGSFYCTNSRITNLNLPALTKCNTELYISDNDYLTSVNMPLLKSIKYFSVTRNNLLTTISFPALTSGQQLTIYNTAITSISCPSLTKIDYLNIENNNSLTSCSFPLLSSIGSMHFNSNNSIASVSFPALTEIVDSNQYNNSNITDCQNLTSISFNNLAVFNNQAFYFSSNKLPSTQVNYLLNRFVSISPALTNKVFYLDQNPPAPPTGQGITDKTTLISRGNSVYTD